MIKALCVFFSSLAFHYFMHIQPDHSKVPTSLWIDWLIWFALSWLVAVLDDLQHGLMGNLTVRCGYVWWAFIPSSCSFFFFFKSRCIFQNKFIQARVISSTNVECFEYFHVQCKATTPRFYLFFFFPPHPQRNEWFLMDYVYNRLRRLGHIPAPLGAIIFPLIDMKTQVESPFR